MDTSPFLPELRRRVSEHTFIPATWFAPVTPQQLNLFPSGFWTNLGLFPPTMPSPLVKAIGLPALPDRVKITSFSHQRRVTVTTGLDPDYHLETVAENTSLLQADYRDIIRSQHKESVENHQFDTNCRKHSRMSCNGCRVLRKGCSESCILRPCLQWIESADAQGHATVFVAKFFGRSGLMGFISAVPPNQRPAVFQSLLYEACGRTVNPVFGAVGLLWAGNWAACQAAVETVLKGGTLRPPSPSSLCEGGMSSLPNLAAAGATFSQGAAPCRQDKSSCPAVETSGLSLANEKSDCFKKVREVREIMRERVQPAAGRFGARQAQMKMQQQPEMISENRLPEMKGDSAEVSRQWAWNNQEINQPSSVPAFRLDLSHVQLARAGCAPAMAKEEQLEDLRRTDGPLVLAPVARRVRPRTDAPDVASQGGRREMMIPSVGMEREQLELDLTLSSNVSAPKQQHQQYHHHLHHHHQRNGSRGLKRVSSPNSSESINSEGSVTSLNSTCDLSLSQVPHQVWNSPANRAADGSLFPQSGSCPMVRKALTLFASP
ncbi:hypothetical protein R1sor_006331 [Riccia sorocarpa]|uniref:LOB domain-containing protein n=1 Tax=Riccia sorocarpa TaxID=122646 RepID=A0ABD3HQY6_9MARC